MNINDLLLLKMQQEVNSYRQWLLQQTPEEILEHSWEFVSKQDIVFSLEENSLNDDLATALFNSESPLEICYKNYNKEETSYMDDIFTSVENSGKNLNSNLNEVVKEYNDEIRDGIAWVIIWKKAHENAEKEVWNGNAVWLSSDKDLFEDYDIPDVEDIIKEDPNAIMINGYYSAPFCDYFYGNEDKIMSNDEISKAIIKSYNEKTNRLADSEAFTALQDSYKVANDKKQEFSHKQKNSIKYSDFNKNGKIKNKAQEKEKNNEPEM